MAEETKRTGKKVELTLEKGVEPEGTASPPQKGDRKFEAGQEPTAEDQVTEQAFGEEELKRQAEESGLDDRILLLSEMMTHAPESEDLDERILANIERQSWRDYFHALYGGLADTMDMFPDAMLEVTSHIPGLEKARTMKNGFRGLMEDMGFTKPRDQILDTEISSAGRITGENLPFMLAPFAFPKIPPAPQVQQFGVRAGAKNVARSVGEFAARRPGAFLSSEFAGATGAGLVGFQFKESFPNNPAAELWGNLVGSLASSGPLVTQIGVHEMGRGWKFMTSMISKKSKQSMAARAIQKNLQEEDILEMMDELDQPDVFEDAPLTPAMKTRNVRLMALQKSLLDLSQDAAGENDKILARINAAIHESLRADPDSFGDIREGVDSAIKAIRTALNENLRQYMKQVQENLSKLAPDASIEDANLAAFKPLQKVEGIARKTESEIWGLVDKDLDASANTASDWFQRQQLEIMKSPTRQTAAGRVELPQKLGLKKLLGRFETKEVDVGVPGVTGKKVEKRRVWVPGDLVKGDSANTGELHRLRSQVLQVIREERAATPPNRNKLRLLGELQEAILYDLGAASEQVSDNAGATLRLALDYSREVNQRFTKGLIGRILGIDKTGAERIDPQMLLSKTIGAGKLQGKVRYDKMKSAFSESEVLSLSDEQLESGDIISSLKSKLRRANQKQSKELNGAVENYIKGIFQQNAVKDGALDVNTAKTLVSDKNLAPLLDEFPALKQQIQGAIRTGSAANILARQVKTTVTRLDNPNISKAALFLQKDPNVYFSEVLGSANPDKEIQTAIKLLQADETGEGLEGLRNAFTEWVLRKSMTSKADASQLEYLSGIKMNRLLNRPQTRIMMARLLNDEQRARLGQVVDEAMRLEEFAAINVSRAGDVEILPSFMTDAAGITGARIGNLLGAGKTIQVPGIVARRFRNLLNLFGMDHYIDIMHKALMKDPELLRALLTEVKTMRDFKKIEEPLRAYAYLMAYQLGHKLPGGLQEVERNQPGALTGNLFQESTRRALGVFGAHPPSFDRKFEQDIQKFLGGQE